MNLRPAKTTQFKISLNYIARLCLKRVAFVSQCCTSATQKMPGGVWDSAVHCCQSIVPGRLSQRLELGSAPSGPAGVCTLAVPSVCLCDLVRVTLSPLAMVSICETRRPPFPGVLCLAPFSCRLLEVSQHSWLAGVRQESRKG